MYQLIKIKGLTSHCMNRFFLKNLKITYPGEIKD